jgi:hypothetical protein
LKNIKAWVKGIFTDLFLKKVNLILVHTIILKLLEILILKLLMNLRKGFRIIKKKY